MAKGKIKKTVIIDGKRFEGHTPIENAEMLTGKGSLITKHNEQSIDLPLLLSSAFLILVVPIGYVYMLTSQLNDINATNNARSTAVAQGTFYYNPSKATPVVGNGVSFMYSPTPKKTNTPQPTYTSTPRPTDNPQTKTPYANVYHIAYSYYNPNLGGVNCHTANWTGSRCNDTTASGIKWSDYLDRGVALPPSYLQVLGYGSRILVTSPDPMKGIYTVVDMCCGCEAANWKDNTYRLDFLSLTQKLTWAYPVTFQVLDYVPPDPLFINSLMVKYCQIGGTPTPNK